MKRCSKCKNSYPNIYRDCPVDHAPLEPIPNTLKKLFFVTIALLFVISSVVVFAAAKPPAFIVNWIASNCEVSLVGIDLDDQDSATGTLARGKKAAELIIRALTGKKDKNEPNHKDSDIILLLSIKNNSFVSFRIDSLNVKFLINSKQIGTGELSGQQIKVTAGEITEIRVPLMLLSFKELLSGGAHLITSDEVTYIVQGQTTVSTLFKLDKVHYPLVISTTNLSLL